MSQVPVARRYARALLDAAAAQADQVLEQLEAVAGLLDSHPDLRALVSSPALTRAQRLGLVEVIINNSVSMLPAVANLLKLLNERSRFEALPFIVRQFRDLVDARLGRVRGKVTSAVALGESQTDALKKQLETLTQRKVVLETKVDSKLLGGVVAQVGSKMYDGSLRSQLNSLGRTLSSRQ